jgi:formylglycine-generating enzyme required for sulfatase activity
MPQPPAKQFSGIFVSYRRDDSSGHAGRLSDKLSDRFGADNVFMDIDHIGPGEDFVQVIEDAVSSCEILIAIIGRDWLSGVDEKGRRLLDKPNDFVRLEIAAALKRSIRVIPILVQGAAIPNPEELPEPLLKLSRLNALELSDVRWKRDVDHLISSLERIITQREEVRGSANAQSSIEEVISQPLSETAEAAKSERFVSRDQSSGSANEESPTRTSGQSRHNSRKRIAMIAGVLIIAVLGALILWSLRTTIWKPSPAEVQPKPGQQSPSDQQTSKAENKPAPPEGMVYVPGGILMMGRDSGDEAERPPHQVTVKPFFIDTYEVTNEGYEKFVTATSHHSPATWRNGSFPSGAERKPVTGVTWDDANDYARWAGKRLPTEEEWEFAARGTDGRMYPWGIDWRQGSANANGAGQSIADVGAYKGTSPFGAYDMVGNAWEWTASNFRAYPGGRLPANQLAGELRVIRGGSYESTRDYATTTYRAGWPARNATAYSQTGFRCVQDASK